MSYGKKYNQPHTVMIEAEVLNKTAEAATRRAAPYILAKT